MKNLYSVVSTYLLVHNIDKTERLYVAFSGGSDSLALLSVLSSIMATKPIAVYVDHNIRSREELDREIIKNKENCDKLGVKLLIHTLEEGEIEALCKKEKITVEASARSLRYSFFDNLDSYVVTDHNKDDQEESVFMKLLTGSTFQSLSAIKSKRGKYLRPLISVTKAEIEAYCRENNLSYSSDSTNSELFCLRNKIRHLVMPTLSSDIKESLFNISQNVEAFLNRIEIISFQDYVLYKTINRSLLINALPLQRDISLINLLSQFTSRRITKGELDSFYLNSITKRSFETNDYIVTFKDDVIRVYPPNFYFSTKLSLNKEFMNCIFCKSDGKDSLLLPNEDLIIRVSEEGDEIETKDKKVKVKELLSSMKIPYCFVVCSKSEIVGVFAKCFGGKNRISRRLICGNWQLLPRYDVICKTLLEC